jgi:hypothetical protein
VAIATAYTERLDADAQQSPIADFLSKPVQHDRFALAVDRGDATTSAGPRCPTRS